MYRTNYLFGTGQLGTYVSCIRGLGMIEFLLSYLGNYFNIAVRGFAQDWHCMWADQGNEQNIAHAPMNQQYEEYKYTALFTALFYCMVSTILQ
jgi:hypothetical protein